MLSLPAVPDLSAGVPHIPPGTGGCSCGQGAAGRAGTPGQPPCHPSPEGVGGTGTSWPCPSRVLVVVLLPGQGGHGEEAQGEGRCGSDIP